MGWNLPPGCSESDLPGNRPEDEAFDYWLENHEDELEGLSEEEVEKLFQAWYAEQGQYDGYPDPPDDWD